MSREGTQTRKLNERNGEKGDEKRWRTEGGGCASSKILRLYSRIHHLSCGGVGLVEVGVGVYGGDV